jgi:hypothetical protein
LHHGGSKIFLNVVNLNFKAYILFSGVPEISKKGWRKTSADVDKYVEKQKPPQKDIVQSLRNIILKTLPGIKEEFKMGVPWYEDKFYVVALKDHVNLGFAVKGLSEQEMALFEGKGKMMRHRKFYSLEDVDEARVAQLLRFVAEKSAGC